MQFNDLYDVQFIKEVKREVPNKCKTNTSNTHNDVIFIGGSRETKPNKLYLLNDLANYDLGNNEQIQLIDSIPKHSSNVNNKRKRSAENIENDPNKVNTYCDDSIINDISNYDAGNLLELVNNSSTSTTTSTNELKTMSPVDPRLETLDPVPNIQDLFNDFDERFFESKLTRFYPIKVMWSSKMTSTAGLFSWSSNGRGLNFSSGAEIKLNINLLKYRRRRDLVETLLHEMIHAYIFILQIRDNGDHGRKFVEIMRNINTIAGTNITVTHDYIEEVNYLRNQKKKQKNSNENRLIHPYQRPIQF